MGEIVELQRRQTDQIIKIWQSKGGDTGQSIISFRFHGVISMMFITLNSHIQSSALQIEVEQLGECTKYFPLLDVCEQP